MNKRNLEIDIEENIDFEQANNAAQELLNDKVIEHDKKLAQGTSGAEDEILSEFADMPEEEILSNYDALYEKDQKLRELLGDNPYTVEEKLSILQAYKKGGGVAGLAEIIEDDDDEQPGNQLEDDGEELDIDLNNPKDV